MKVTATAIPGRAAASSRRSTRTRADSFSKASIRSVSTTPCGRNVQLRAGQSFPFGQTRSARTALSNPPAAGKVGARRTGRGLRRGRRSAPQLADVRKIRQRRCCRRPTRNSSGSREGFAHGFLVLSEAADVLYKTTDYYAPDDERCLIWNDPDIGIDWPETANRSCRRKTAPGLPLSKAEVFA